MAQNVSEHHLRLLQGKDRRNRRNLLFNIDVQVALLVDLQRVPALRKLYCAKHDKLIYFEVSESEVQLDLWKYVERF